jgi:predicted  nucleic acid-binding Zn-ribbon protein
MAELTLEMIRALFREELAPLSARMDKLAATVEAMRPNVEGIPVLHRAIGTIHQEQRMMKAAINEIARTQFTSSEVQALHADVNAVQARDTELETRILTLQREIKETKQALEETNEAVEALKRR